MARTTRTFSPSSAHISLARLFVRESLGAWGLLGAERLVHDLVLAASELVTNAVLHGEGDVEVSLRLTPDAVRMVVSDEGHQDVPRALAASRAGAFTGRGLRIVDGLASHWGSGRNARGGTAVWLEMPRA